MPTWLAVCTPVLAFLGGLVGHLITRGGLRSLERWRRREETMRMLRWAGDMAVSPDVRSRLAGVAAIEALQATRDLVQVEDDPFIDMVLVAVTVDTAEAYRPTHEDDWTARDDGRPATAGHAEA